MSLAIEFNWALPIGYSTDYAQDIGYVIGSVFDFDINYGTDYGISHWFVFAFDQAIGYTIGCSFLFYFLLKCRVSHKLP